MPDLRLVVFVVFDGMQALDVVGPLEVFAFATRHALVGGYRLHLASLDGKSVRSDSGLVIDVDSALVDVEDHVDTLIVVGGQGARTAARGALVRDLGPVVQRSGRICSVCTGAIILAAGGWLNGKIVTTHWSEGNLLAEQYPGITVDPDRIFVQDGNVFTSGGITSGMDLALSLVERDHNSDVARSVARQLVLFLQRPGGQSQFSERFEHRISSKSPLRVVVDSVLADPAADHRLREMAERAHVSGRHLARLFKQHANTTPAAFVERIRVGVARDYLEQTSVGIDVVASRSGFGSAETMRRAFARAVGVSPSDYRQRFSVAGHFPS